MNSKTLRSIGAALVALLFVPGAFAQEAVIRKTLAERMPKAPTIDEVTKTAIPGIYELRSGTKVFYTDERGDYLIEGSITETRTGVDLTQARVEKLTAFDFASLPLKDAIVWKQGTGARKIVVFADPNCGYCKKFETESQQLKDVTVYTFLYPILGGDSPAKAREIWCAKDNGSAWRNWMIRGAMPVRNMGPCDTSALQRNVALGQRHAVEVTPLLVFEDGKRVNGAQPPELIEKQLAASRGKV